MAERGTFILHFLRSSLLAHPHSMSLCDLTPSHSYRLFFWFFPVTSPPLPLPCPALASKVTLGILVEKFGYLISYRGVRQLSPSFFLFLYLSELLTLSLFSPHSSRFVVTHATRPSTFPLRGTTVLLELFMYCSLWDNFTLGEKICRVWSSWGTRTTNLITYYASGSENIRICNSFLILISRSPLSDCTEDYFFHRTTEVRNFLYFKKFSMQIGEH